MATWWELTFTGEPTENDFARVSEMTAQGFTSGQLINEPGGGEERGAFLVIDNVTNRPVRSFPTRALAEQLAYGLNLNAGPGGRYGVRPG